MNPQELAFDEAAKLNIHATEEELEALRNALKESREFIQQISHWRVGYMGNHTVYCSGSVNTERVTNLLFIIKQALDRQTSPGSSQG